MKCDKVYILSVCHHCACGFLHIYHLDYSRTFHCALSNRTKATSVARKGCGNLRATGSTVP